MKRTLAIAIVAAILVGCAVSEPTNGKHEVRTLTLSESEQELCARQKQFSIDMLRVMSEGEEGNVFISPLSAAIVSAMVANGAKGETQSEILHAIGAEGYSMSELNAHYLNLMENLPYLDATTLVKIANAAYIDEGYPVDSTYKNEVATHYLAEVNNLDLSNPASADVINSWAAKNTDGMVKKVCDGDYFSEDLHLVLINALCFKGQWEEQFKKANTYAQTFHATTGDIEVEMMHAELEKAYASYGVYGENGFEEAEAGVLRMYYKGRGYCMDVVLPNEDKTVDECLTWLTTEWIDNMLRHAMEAEVAFPKFKLENRYNLNPYMAQLGMQRVFTSAADLTGISTASRLYLALLQQDTYIEVDEEGTKAAAVTTGWINDKAMPETPFIVDRPFIFFIRDVKNGIILFAGRVNNPKQ